MFLNIILIIAVLAIGGLVVFNVIRKNKNAKIERASCSR